METQDLQLLASCDCLLVQPNNKGFYEIWANMHKEDVVRLDREDLIKTIRSMYSAIDLVEFLKALTSGEILYVDKDSFKPVSPAEDEVIPVIPKLGSLINKGGLASGYQMNPLFGTSFKKR